jgi:hypothetical protein
MNIIQLANSIRNFAIGHYIPFQGFDETKIIPHVQKHFDVTDQHVMLALEYICQKGG